MTLSAPKEGKIEVSAGCDGLFLVDSQRLTAVNCVEDVMIATRHSGTAVHKGDKLTGTRVIPLIVPEETLQKAEQAAGTQPLLALHPWKRKTAAIITTGGEVAQSLIEDTFTPVVEKLAAYRIEIPWRSMPEDNMDGICRGIRMARSAGVGMIVCTAA